MATISCWYRFDESLLTASHVRVTIRHTRIVLHPRLARDNKLWFTASPRETVLRWRIR